MLNLITDIFLNVIGHIRTILSLTNGAHCINYSLITKPVKNNFKNKIPCNSKCHDNSPFRNKWLRLIIMFETLINSYTNPNMYLNRIFSIRDPFKLTVDKLLLKINFHSIINSSVHQYICRHNIDNFHLNN